MVDAAPIAPHSCHQANADRQGEGDIAQGLGIRDLTGEQVESWWARFKRLRNISAHRGSSYRRGIDELVLPLVCCYRALLHDAVRHQRIQWLGNGDDTQVTLEPVSSKCLDDNVPGSGG